MSIDKIIVAFAGFALIGFIYWFFFGRKETVSEIGDLIEVLVEGGYKPENIKVKMGKETAITFLRNDSSTCLEEVVIPEFRTKVYLPLGKPVTITINPKKKGEFEMHCGMNMYHGKIIVV
jgi:plastocyanin domain-containing protein